MNCPEVTSPAKFIHDTPQEVCHMPGYQDMDLLFHLHARQLQKILSKMTGNYLLLAVVSL
jgi:hypothetical protein